MSVTITPTEFQLELCTYLKGIDIEFRNIYYEWLLEQVPRRRD